MNNEESNSRVDKLQRIRRRIKENRACLICIRRWAGGVRKYVTFCSVVVMAGLLVGGCASIQEAWMKGYVAVHDAADAALSNKPPVVVSGVTNAPPVADPAPVVDVSKPLTMPLRSHGSEAQVDKWLEDGGAPECGLISPDIRAQLVRPSGKTWGYAPFWKSGAFLGLKDGKVSFRDVSFEGQTYTFIGYSAGDHLNEATKAKAGDSIKYVEAGHGMFTYWETRD